MGSLAAVVVNPTLTSYSVAKAGLTHLTRIQAVEFAPSRVRINCINPATVKTQFHRAAGFSEKDAESYYEATEKLHPLGRIGNTNDVVEMIMFLADSNKSGWITGQCIGIDGGRSLLSALPASKPQVSSKL